MELMGFEVKFEHSQWLIVRWEGAPERLKALDFMVVKGHRAVTSPRSIIVKKTCAKVPSWGDKMYCSALLPN